MAAEGHMPNGKFAKDNPWRFTKGHGGPPGNPSGKRGGRRPGAGRPRKSIAASPPDGVTAHGGDQPKSISLSE